MNTKDPDNIWKIIEATLRFKAAMVKAQKLSARCKCPFCEKGMWTGQINSISGRIKMTCSGCHVYFTE